MKHKYIVKFKSTPENWTKESIGWKRNTVRKADTDERFMVLDSFINKYTPKIQIVIENTETHATFKRTVSDVTKWEGFYIISWS
jgi:hypothetical protein